MRLASVKQFDWITLAVVGLLLGFGLIMVYSTTYGGGVLAPSDFLRQLLYVGVGVGFAIGLSFVDYRLYRNYTAILYFVLIALLVGVLIFGIRVRGAQSWFDFGFYRFQPAELAKLLLVLVLAKYFADHRHDRHRWRYVIVSGVYTFIPAVLIAAQPDMGSAIILIGTWVGMLLVSGLPWQKIAMSAAIGVVAASIVWTFLLEPYQKDRILVLFNPNTQDTLKQGYNVAQAVIAIGSGGVVGKGLGQGSQSTLRFLPEQHTDFIYAVTAEELGLWGSIFLLGLFGLFLMRTVRIAKTARDDYGMFLALGIGFVFIVQIVINVGMNLDIMPVTGIPLPFISFGGNAMLVFLSMVGILQSVHLHQKTIDFKKR